MSTVIFRLAVICLAVALCVVVADAALVPLSDIVMVKGGISYSLALKSDGTVLAWGNNRSGQLGNGGIFAQATPVQTFGLGSGSGVTAVAAGDQFSLALKYDGTVLAWGSNDSGELGDGKPTNSNVPVQVVCRAGDTSGSTFCSSAGVLQGVAAIIGQRIRRRRPG